MPPRSPLLLAALGLLVHAARAADPDPQVVGAVRALLDARKEEEREELKAALLKRPDLDWVSLRKGLEEGPYYQKPLETAYGERNSAKNFDLVFSPADGKPRGFHLYVPRKYDAKTPIPVIVYLHHDPDVEHVQQGAERAGQAVARFRAACEERGILFVAPYTCKGAEWWVAAGRDLVAWTLKRVRQRYNVDDDRIALLGALGGGDAVWYLGQEMPGTWSALMPMTGDPWEITAMIRPLFLGTLDRMDILMGVPGKTLSNVGEKDAGRFLAELKPLFGQRMRITAAVWPSAHGDFSYLEDILPQIVSFACDRRRKAYAEEVDVETEAGGPLRSLWLRNDGYDPDGPAPHGFASTHLEWKAPEAKDPQKAVGLQLEPREGVPGLTVTGTPGDARHAQIFPDDVVLEVDGAPVASVDDFRAAVGKRAWDDEVRLLIARDVEESDLARHERTEERYRAFRRKVAELRSEGKPVPPGLWDEMAEEEGPGVVGCGEEEDESGIITSSDEEGEAAPGRAGKAAKKVARVVERWVRLRRPAGPLVRAGFGLRWDPDFDKEGVKISSVYAGSLADRSGFRPGDVIVQVGDTQVKTVHDIERYFATVDEGGKPFRFEEEPEGQNAIDFTIRRPNQDGTYQADRQLTVTWRPVRSSRVDGKWNKKENTLRVLAYKASGFTLYFTDDLIPPGREFHLFVNDVPYQDLVDPAGAPEYPQGHDMSDVRYRMRLKRAKVEGWTPDLPWALEDFLGSWDRRQVYGAKRSFDLTKMKEGFAKARRQAQREPGELGERIRRAYEEFRGRAKG